MKKSKYRELYHPKENHKTEKSTTSVENKKENIEKEKRGFNVFFELKNDKKKSSDE